MRIFNKLFGSADSATVATPDRASRVFGKQPPKRRPSGGGNLSAGPQMPVKIVPNALRGAKRVEVVSSPTDSTSVDGVLHEVVEAFDEAFDKAHSSEKPAYSENRDAPLEAADQVVVQDLFSEIAANYARPVKDFMRELRRGIAAKERLGICRIALHSIWSAAENMGFVQAATPMKDFDKALSIAQTSSQQLLVGEPRRLILTTYQKLVEVLPQVFLPGQQEESREDIVIKSLLMQIPGLGRVTFERLYGAGLGSLNVLFLANKQDLNAATGIPLSLCEHICEKFQQYHSEGEGLSGPAARATSRSRLRDLVGKLRGLHEGVERPSVEIGSNPELATEKRKLRKQRQQRQQCFHQIVAILAELVELDLINVIQKLPFRRRLQRLEEYLARSGG